MIAHPTNSRLGTSMIRVGEAPRAPALKLRRPSRDTLFSHRTSCWFRKRPNLVLSTAEASWSSRCTGIQGDPPERHFACVCQFPREGTRTSMPDNPDGCDAVRLMLLLTWTALKSLFGIQYCSCERISAGGLPRKHPLSTSR